MCMYVRSDIVMKKTKNTPEDCPMVDEEGKLKAFRRAEDWERLAILEVRVNDHDEEIAHLVKHQEKLSHSLESINRTLLTIRTALFTSIGLIALIQLGLKEFVTRILM